MGKKCLHFLLFFQMKLNLDQALHLPDTLGSVSLSWSIYHPLLKWPTTLLGFLIESWESLHSAALAFSCHLGVLWTLVWLVTAANLGSWTHFLASSSSSYGSRTLLAFVGFFFSDIHIPTGQRGFLLELYSQMVLLFHFAT